MPGHDDNNPVVSSATVSGHGDHHRLHHLSHHARPPTHRHGLLVHDREATRVTFSADECHKRPIVCVARCPRSPIVRRLFRCRHSWLSLWVLGYDDIPTTSTITLAAPTLLLTATTPPPRIPSTTILPPASPLLLEPHHPYCTPPIHLIPFHTFLDPNHCGITLHHTHHANCRTPPHRTP
jgi:hypothetical protein